MILTSLAFIIFCIAVVSGFYILPYKIRWAWVLAANLVFYLSAGAAQVIFIIIAACITWAGSQFMERNIQREKVELKKAAGLAREDRKKIKQEGERKRKRILFIMLMLVLGQLAILKYNKGFLGNIGQLFQALPLGQGIAAPLGISFYSLFCIGYCIDVYRGQYSAEKNFLKYFTTVTFFPCISQGPFERYGHLSGQLFSDKKFQLCQVIFGAELMLWGFFKKMVVADNIAPFVKTVFGEYPGEGYGGLFVITAVFCYAIQIYADFSGYMDIVLGLCQTMGIDLVQNFNTPYFSRSIPEFWRRWHMSLGSWFKDYIFYSVLRSQWCQSLTKKAGKFFPRAVSVNIATSAALLINWLLIGFWHGLEWKFIVYNMYFGLVMVLGVWMKPIYGKASTKLGDIWHPFFYKLFQTARTFLAVCFAYVLLCSENIRGFLFHLKEILCFPNPQGFFSYRLFALGISRAGAAMLFLAVMLLFFVEALHRKGHSIRAGLAKQNIIVRWMLIFGLIYAVILFGAYGSDYDTSSFIYQAF